MIGSPVVMLMASRSWQTMPRRHLLNIEHIKAKNMKIPQSDPVSHTPKRLLLMCLSNLLLQTIRFVTFDVPHNILTFLCQAINLVECQQFRDLLLMLWKELRESDIPHRTTIRKQVEEVFKLSEHFDQLEREMAVRQLSCLFLELHSYCCIRIPWERFPSPWICGQTLISHRSWQ